MSALLNLSEATIRRMPARSHSRGNQLLAAVQGSEYLLYRVRITLGPGTLAQATCSCPYD